MLQNLAVWMTIGVFVGWLANHRSHASSMGLILNAIIGGIGALVGALTLSLILPQQAPLGMFSLYSLLGALIVAVCFTSIARVATSLSAMRSNR